MSCNRRNDSAGMPVDEILKSKASRLFLMWLLAWIVGVLFVVAYVHVIAFCVFMTLPGAKFKQRPSFDWRAFDTVDFPTEDPLDQ